MIVVFESNLLECFIVNSDHQYLRSITTLNYLWKGIVFTSFNAGTQLGLVVLFYQLDRHHNSHFFTSHIPFANISKVCFIAC